jgi:hypothetical protein
MFEMDKDHLWHLLEEEECLLADGFDDAVIGISHQAHDVSRAVYDIGKIIAVLCEDDEMTDEDAMEHFEYNIAGAYVGPKTPIFVFGYGK